MNRDMHHRVHTRFVEGIVERRDAGFCGSDAGICVPNDDGVAGRFCFLSDLRGGLGFFCWKIAGFCAGSRRLRISC